MNAIGLIVLAAPVVGYAIASVLSIRTFRQGLPTRPVIPVVVQRGVDHAHALLTDSSPIPANATPTATRGVYFVADVGCLGGRPALVTIGRIGEDDVLVDITQAGVLL